MNEQTHKEIIEQFNDGLLPKQIADNLSVSMHTVIEALKRRLHLVDEESRDFAAAETASEAALDHLRGRLRIVDDGPAASDGGALPDSATPPIADREVYQSVSPEVAGGADDAGVDAMASAPDAALHTLFRHRLDQLEPGLQEIAAQPNLPDSRFRPRLLASDRRGAAVVVAFIAGAADDRTLAGVLASMGWLMELNGTAPRGIIVAGSFPDSVRHTARVVPGLSLKSFAFAFQFEEIS